MEGGKELNDLFSKAKKAQENYSFEEVKLQFEANVAAGVQPMMPKNGLNLGKWMLGLSTVATIGLGVWFLSKNEPAKPNTTDQVAEIAQKKAELIKEKTDTANFAEPTIDHLDFKIINLPLPWKASELDGPICAGVMYDLPFTLELPTPSGASKDTSKVKEMKKDYQLPVLTEEEIKEMQDFKNKMLRSILKEDKDSWSFIPNGEHNGQSIQAFYISRTEVTNEEYRTFLYDLVYQKRVDEFRLAVPDHTQWSQIEGFNEPMEKLYFSHPAYNRYPVVNISREGAKMYCQWLSIELSNYAIQKGHGSINPVRLPMRAEWEYAAGLENGNQFTLHAPDKEDSKKNNPAPPNFKGILDGGMHTTLVTGGMMSEHGLYHMLGNVAEMVIEKNGCPNAVGGSWMLEKDKFETDGFEPYMNKTEASPDIGFRVVITHLKNGGLIQPMIPKMDIIMPELNRPNLRPVSDTSGIGYDKVGPFGEYHKKWALIEVDRKLGFIDEYGSQVIAPKYDGIDHFKVYQKKWALVSLNGRYGFIDSYGYEVVPPIYEEIGSFGEYKKDWALIVLDGKYGFINKYGDVVVKPEYDAIDHFGVIKKNWAMVYKEGKQGFIDEFGDFIGN